MLVKDVPKHYILIQDTQDIQFYEKYLGVDLSDYGALFVDRDDKVISVFGCELFTPYLHKPVVKLYPFVYQVKVIQQGCLIETYQVEASFSREACDIVESQVNPKRKHFYMYEARKL